MNSPELFNNTVSQQTADQIRWVLLILLAIFTLWAGASTFITWRNYRQMVAGQGRNRTRWICQIFFFLTLTGAIEIMLTKYRIGKTMSEYLFALYIAQSTTYAFMVISATGFMLSLFGRSLWRVVTGWWQNGR